MNRIKAAVLWIPVVALVCFTIVSLIPDSNVKPPAPESSEPAITESSDSGYSKKEIQELIGDLDLGNITEKSFSLTTPDGPFRIDTSIDIALQRYLLTAIDRAKKRERGHPRYLAFVVLEPATGKILAMAGYDKTDPRSNTCIDGTYPAASIFKIVTAAAAVEECGLTPGSRLKFNGNKYTLYKRQLTDRTNKYTNRISFKDSFAQSVNPVFGKLGSLQLGRATLEKYAEAFGFNQTIDFEAPFPESRLTLSDEPYQWAEIACGFNRDTLITPLHGALLSGTVINKGKLPEPTIIERIVDLEGNVIYNGSTRPVSQAIKPETSDILKTLMARTITSGTGQKSFRGFKKDPVLGKLSIGGKTGSIYNKNHDVRFDWFVGFAVDKRTDSKLAVSIVVGHEKYIGTKACRYARMVMKHYFSNQYAQEETDQLVAHFNDH